jgi:hypothetical protein
MLLILKLQWSDNIMYAIDVIGEMGCTQYASTIEDAYKIATTFKDRCIITFIGAM